MDRKTFKAMVVQATADGKYSRQITDKSLEELPEEQRMVFVMRNIEGLSLRDIAEALDCSVNTVRSRKILAVKKLRYLLSEFFAHNFETTLQEHRS